MPQSHNRLQSFESYLYLPTASVHFQDPGCTHTSIKRGKDKDVSCRFNRFRFYSGFFSAIFSQRFQSCSLGSFFAFFQCANPSWNQCFFIRYPGIPIPYFCLTQRPQVLQQRKTLSPPHGKWGYTTGATIKNPRIAKSSITHRLLDSSDVFGFRNMRNARVGLPRNGKCRPPSSTRMTSHTIDNPSQRLRKRDTRKMPAFPP